MSGIDEILPWALENYPTKNYDDFQDWFADVSLDFQDNNRLPLEEILDNEEMNMMEQAFDQEKEQEEPSEPEDIQRGIDDIREPEEPIIADPPRKEENIIISGIKEIGRSIKNFFGF